MLSKQSVLVLFFEYLIDNSIILLVILWLGPRVGHRDDQDDWNPLITYFQVALSYNLEKHNLLVSDDIT
jgi:hypothetical protein